MKSGIYKIQNKVNGKLYIGSAVKLNWRRNKHFTELRHNKHHCLPLQRAFEKYKEDNFLFEIILECPIEYLIECEQWYIDNLKPEYNICKIAGSCLGVKRRKESIQKKIDTEKEIMRIRDMQIVEVLQKGIQQKEVAKIFNLSPSVITKVKKLYNIDTNIKRNGVDNGYSKLSEQQVKEIKILLKNKTKQQEIADLYNVKLRTIKAIQSGQNWSHITIE